MRWSHSLNMYLSYRSSSSEVHDIFICVPFLHSTMNFTCRLIIFSLVQSHSTCTTRSNFDLISPGLDGGKRNGESVTLKWCCRGYNLFPLCHVLGFVTTHRYTHTHTRTQLHHHWALHHHPVTPTPPVTPTTHLNVIPDEWTTRTDLSLRLLLTWHTLGKRGQRGLPLSHRVSECWSVLSWVVTGCEALQPDSVATVRHSRSRPPELS